MALYLVYCRWNMKIYPRTISYTFLSQYLGFQESEDQCQFLSVYQFLSFFTLDSAESSGNDIGCIISGCILFSSWNRPCTNCPWFICWAIILAMLLEAMKVSGIGNTESFPWKTIYLSSYYPIQNSYLSMKNYKPWQKTRKKHNLKRQINHLNQKQIWHMCWNYIWLICKKLPWKK